MPRDRGITDRAKRKKQTAKKRPAENDSVGESSTRPASMGKRMRALATQAAAARAYLDSPFGPDLPAQLSTLADTVRELEQPALHDQFLRAESAQSPPPPRSSCATNVAGGQMRRSVLAAAGATSRPRLAELPPV